MHSEIFVIDTNDRNIDVDVSLYFENDFILELLKKEQKKKPKENEMKKFQDIDFDKVEIDSVDLSLKLEWSFNLEMRSWGVKNCDAVADKVGDVHAYIVLVNHDTDEFFKEREVELIDIDLSEFEIETERIPENNYGDPKTQFNLETIDIDFKDKTITAHF